MGLQLVDVSPMGLRKCLFYWAVSFGGTPKKAAHDGALLSLGCHQKHFSCPSSYPACGHRRVCEHLDLQPTMAMGLVMRLQGPWGLPPFPCPGPRNWLCGSTTGGLPPYSGRGPRKTGWAVEEEEEGRARERPADERLLKPNQKAERQRSRNATGLLAQHSMGVAACHAWPSPTRSASGAYPPARWYHGFL